MDYQLYELVGLNQKSLIDHIKVSRDKFNHLYGGFEHATKYYYLYNFFTISSCNQDVYLLYLKLLKCIKQYFDFKSINASQVWMQTWMNIHTENNVLTSHSHAYPIHGYLSLSNHDTDTVFTDELPVVDVTYKDGRFFYLSSNKIFQGSLVTTLDTDDDAISTSVSNVPPSDPTYSAPTVITKINSAPYVGSLFLSQNSQTWSADQNESMMFVIERCVFSVGTLPTLQFVVPNKLPYRKVVEQDIGYYLNPNTISTSVTSCANTDVLVDAFNLSTNSASSISII